MKNNNKEWSLDSTHELLLRRQIEVVREEGRSIRATIWLAVFVLLAAVLFTPLLFAAWPIVLVILGLGALAATAGALIGKYLTRRRERKILQEVRLRTPSVVEGHFDKPENIEPISNFK